MTKGSYTAKITKDATGEYFVLVTYEGQCVPGIRGRYYATKAAAQKGAALMLKKATA